MRGELEIGMVSMVVVVVVLWRRLLTYTRPILMLLRMRGGCGTGIAWWDDSEVFYRALCITRS